MNFEKREAFFASAYRLLALLFAALGIAYVAGVAVWLIFGVDKSESACLYQAATTDTGKPIEPSDTLQDSYTSNAVLMWFVTQWQEEGYAVPKEGQPFKWSDYLSSCH